MREVWWCETHDGPLHEGACIEWLVDEPDCRTARMLLVSPTEAQELESKVVDDAQEQVSSTSDKQPDHPVLS